MIALKRSSSEILMSALAAERALVLDVVEAELIRAPRRPRYLFFL